jgi:hypothetical protein
MRLGRSILIATLALVAGCDTSSTAPDGVVTGRWGGPGAEILADPGRVRVVLSCPPFFVGPAIVPDVSGRFVVALTPGSPPRGVQATTVRGTVSGSSITFEAITITSTGTFTQSYRVDRDVPGDFSAVLCLAS